MLYLELTTTNIILVAAVAALFLIFLFLFLKLNPSVETRRKTEADLKNEKSEQEQPQPFTSEDTELSAEAIPQSTDEKPVILVTSPNAETGLQSQQESETMALIPDQTRRVPIPEETVTLLHSQQIPPPVSPLPKEVCAHHFGYLRTFPKDSAFPDGCLACEKILNCLANTKAESEK